MIRGLYFFLFFMTQLTCFGQSTYDSLRLKLNTSSGELKVDVLNELASFFQTSSGDSVGANASRAFQLSREIGYKKGLVQAYTLLGLSKRMLSQYDSSLIYYRHAMELSDKERMPSLHAEILMGIGGVFYYKNSPDSAMSNFVKAAELFETLGMEKRLASAYSNLGMIMNANGQGEKALSYFLKALKYAQVNKLLSVQLPVMVNLATYYENKEQYDSALYYADACYQISAENNMKYGMGRALLILPNIYAKLELFDRSLNSAREGITLFEESGNEVLVRRMIYQEAIALAGLGQYKSAILKCELLLEQLESDDSFKEQVYLLMSEVYEGLNNTAKGLEYHKLFFDAYKNSALEEQNNRLAELEAKYDTEKKSREIESLTDKARLQELKIQQQVGIIIGSLVIGVIIILFMLLYYRQRELKKKNELLTLQQRLLRSQMNPHFIFNALSAIQKFVIKNDAIEGASFIAKFGTLMRQFLDQSRQNYISIEEEVKTLTNYLEVQQLRFDNKFEFSIKIENGIDASNTLIPPLLAQPFVENAIEHGFTRKEKDARVDITFTLVDGELYLTIIDNGVGMLAAKSTNHKSLATKITEDRLRILLGNRSTAKVIINDRKGIDSQNSGVEVKMVVPIKQ